MHFFSFPLFRGPHRSRLLVVGLVAGLALGSAACTAEATAADSSVVGSPSGSTSPVAEEPSVVQGTFTTPIPPPAGEGDVSETVAPREETVQPPVDLTASAVLAELAVTLPSIVATEAVAVGPGEIGGPGVAVEISLENRSEQPVPLDGVSVVLVDAAGQVTPMITTGDEVRPVTGSLEPGATATGVYVFTLPESARSTVTITVSDAGTATSVVFTGSAV